MLPWRRRRQWLLLVPLGFLTSLLEAGAAAGIYSLILVLSDPARGFANPSLARVVAMLPLKGPRAIILQLTAGLALYYIAKNAILVATEFLRQRVSHDSTAELSCAMLRRYLSAPYPFHFKRNSSELIRNCSSSVADVLGSVLGSSIGIVNELLMVTGLVVVLLRTSPMTSLVAGLFVMAIMLIVLRFTRHAAWIRGSQSYELSAKTLKSLQQALGGIKEVKVLGRERFFYDEFVERQRQALFVGQLTTTLGVVPSMAIQTVLFCGALTLIAILSVLGRTGIETLPLAGVFGYAGLRVVPMSTGIVQFLNAIRGSRYALDQLYDDYLTLGAGDAHEDDADFAHLEFRDRIVLDHVSYAYPGAQEPALHDVSLTIRRGESIGIIGPTGAGKSTLVDVILGLLPPSSGRITVDGTDLGRAAAPWRRRVGYVPQTLFLIDDTLRRNIALGIKESEIDDARIAAALVTAQLQHFSTDLPQGLETRVGERGIRLSGGERQRLAIARALYHDPDVIVFDEATSSLDVATEAEVTRAIDALRGVKTTVVIAHRLSTVRECNRLVWLQKGRIVGLGSFDDLRDKSGEFRALAALASL
jgi:ATP-binding cassette subfamily C protein